MHTIPDDAVIRFWSRVNKSGDCWLWTGHQNAPGRYGRIRIGGKSLLTHRVSWALANGPIPDDLCVLHLCDTTLCVRPSHLTIGTQHQNIMDSVIKGRWTQGQPRGEKHAMAKLTNQDARAILGSAERTRVLADRYGVCRQTVEGIRRRKTWKNLS